MDRDRLGLTTHLPGWPLGLFRIAFGLLYLDMAQAPWIDYGWLRGFIETEIAPFLVELALGLGLLFGVLTRLCGFGGVLWHVGIAIQAFQVPGEWYWIAWTAGSGPLSIATRPAARAGRGSSVTRRETLSEGRSCGASGRA